MFNGSNRRIAAVGEAGSATAAPMVHWSPCGDLGQKRKNSGRYPCTPPQQLPRPRTSAARGEGAAL